MAELFANNAYSTLASGINGTDLSLTVGSGHGSRFPSPTSGDHFKVTLTQASSEASWEVVKVTARSGDVFTVERGQDGTSAASWAGGSKAQNRLSATTCTHGLLQKVTVTLNNAQIKSLPTAGVTIVPPTETLNYTDYATSLPIPVAAYFVLDDLAGAYTNTDVLSYLRLVWGDFDSEWSLKALGTSLSSAPGAKTLIRLSSEVIVGDPFGFTGEIIQPQGTQLDQLLDNRLAFWASNNGAGDFTGGHAANTLTLTVFYTVAPV